MLCAMSGAWLALRFEVKPLLVLVLVSVITLLFVIPGEIAQRFRAAWRPSLRDNYYPDGITVIINNLLLQSSAVQLVIAAAAIGLAGGGLQVWPNHWPLYLQLPLALIVSEFGAYWWHRATHELPWLWRLHKIHHSPLRLYWLNATKFHYLDMTLLQACTVMPILILGADKTTVLYVTLFSIFHGYWQHGNTRQELGLLNYIFSNAELHRWHHNNNPRLANNNYGSNLIIWDLLFGTFLWPERGHGNDCGADIAAIGLRDRDYPTDPFVQLVQPFTRIG